MPTIWKVLGLTLILSCEGSCWAVSATSRLKSERIRRTVSEPTATAKPHRITNVSNAETPARRRRIGSRSNVAVSLCAKDVARSPDGVQQTRLAVGLELAAHVGDEHLDRVGRGEGVIAPHLVEQALARDHDPLVAHQVLEQLELALRELDGALAACDLVGVAVEQQVADAQRSRAAWRPAAQQGAHPRQQLLALEWLDEIVIGACVEALDTGLQSVARSQDQDRDRKSTRLNSSH